MPIHRGAKDVEREGTHVWEPARRNTPFAAQAGDPLSTSSTSSPYFRSFESPTPETRSRSTRLEGRAAAIAFSVESWKITYAGTPLARAVSRRQRRSRSTISAGASESPTFFASAGNVSAGIVLSTKASRPADVSSTTGYSPAL